MKTWQEESRKLLNDVLNGSKPGDGWGAWETACLTEFSKKNPEHPINARFSMSVITGKVYVENFTGNRANPANYEYPIIGTTVILDGEILP